MIRTWFRPSFEGQTEITDFLDFFFLKKNNRPSPLANASQATLTNWASSTSTILHSSNTPSPPSPSEELFLHVTPQAQESPADAIKRPYSLSSRDIDAIAYNVRSCLLNFDNMKTAVH